MVELRLLLLRAIMHPLDLPRLLSAQQPLLLPIGDLLILLHHVAGLAATRTQTVGAAVTLQMVFCAYVAAVDHGENEGDTEAAEAEEGPALWRD
jgi:hypothetical protein